jgi:hypothetical protein
MVLKDGYFIFLMNVLVLGSGKYYKIYENRCFPQSLGREEFITILTDPNNKVTYIDNDREIEPDILVDVTKKDWDTKIGGPFDIIIDTISHIGPHVGSKIYKDVFKVSCRRLLKEGGIFYGHYRL